MKSIALFGAIAVALLSPGCAGSSDRDPVSKAPTIVTLRLRSGFVDIESGAAGITYNVLDLEGKALASGLSEAELKAKFPGHFQALEKALAGDKTRLLDASLQQIEGSLKEPGGPLLHFLHSAHDR